MTKTAWKVLAKGMVSDVDPRFKWRKNKWYKHKGELVMCNEGFHASKLLFDAIRYVTPGIICRVEYKGEVKEKDDKLVAQEMRVIKTYRFTKKKAVKWAVYCAKQSLKYFEKEFPDDKRPRAAINAANNWLKNPTKKNQRIAESTSRLAARSATKLAIWSAKSTAWSAARSAARSAESATKSAESAARSAIWSTESATRSAGLAAKKKILRQLIKILKED